MSILFFKLNGVPEDEANEVRELLTDHGIEFYETNAGNWGVSLAAIWLYDANNLPQAQALFDSYQQQRAATQRALYQQRLQQGQGRGFWRHNLQNPIRFLGYTAVMLLVIYVSVKWLFELGL